MDLAHQVWLEVGESCPRHRRRRRRRAHRRNDLSNITLGLGGAQIIDRISFFLIDHIGLLCLGLNQGRPGRKYLGQIEAYPNK